MRPCNCQQTPCRCPKYPAYAVVDAHSNEVVSVHKTRRDATAAVTSFAHRVRGTYAKATA